VDGLVEDALMAGEILPAGKGRSYSRSYVKDTARSEECTFVATSSPADQGVYNNWRPAAEMRALLQNRMRGASSGKTMLVRVLAVAGWVEAHARRSGSAAAVVAAQRPNSRAC
jgi:GTP-dependent phosphoenolpyruvate carboxykinase